MNIHKIWGQGQLFAFSALDGDSYASDDFVGTLSGDRIGVRFFSQVKRELAYVIKDCCELKYNAVTSDYISFVLNESERYHTKKRTVRMIYHNTHLIIGEVCEYAEPVVFVEGRADVRKNDDIEIQDTKNGEFTALKICDGKFAFAYGKTEEEVVKLVEEGMKIDINMAEEKKLQFYRENMIEATDEHERLYSKCLSVMKTQLYSPEGCMKGIWSTPDRLPHKRLWLWDSVFHAIGHRHISGELAEKLILAIFFTQREDGFIPHMAHLKGCSDITQPPVIAWGAYKVYETTKNIEFLKKVYEHNKRFLEWCRQNRREKDDELYIWDLNENSVNCRCDESGMDNSSRFDESRRLQAIDFACFMANEVKYMKKISEMLGYEEEKMYSDWYDSIKEAINRKLWDEEDGFYYDYDTKNGELHKVASVASFLVFLAGVCDGERAKRVISQLDNPEMFDTKLPIATVAVKDKTYGPDMWRGPVWINFNYMVCDGLEESGHVEVAEKIRNRTIECMNKWYKQSGVIFEFYDSEDEKSPKVLNRKGEFFEPYNFQIKLQTIRDFGWSCTLLCDMLYEKYSKQNEC